MRAESEGRPPARQSKRGPMPPRPPVLIAPEMSAVHMLHDRGYPSVLYDVIPRVPFDSVSYSCYESLDHPDPVSALVADLDLIRLITGSNRVLLGEMAPHVAAIGHGGGKPDIFPRRFDEVMKEEAPRCIGSR